MRDYDLASFTLAQLPREEDDDFEFKCSKLKVQSDLPLKLSCAVSAFANSGGGFFVVGVDSKGSADGGIPRQVGTQDLRDWVDQVMDVEPRPQYSVTLIEDSGGRGTIVAGNVVLVVAVAASQAGPHMARDRCYYIRAGAHTERARHHLVEALWARRGHFKPRVAHVVREKPSNPEVLQVGIITLTEAPALNAELHISPLPESMSGCEEDFPVKISAIDRANPLFFDVGTRFGAGNTTDMPFNLSVTYEDLASNHYRYDVEVNLTTSLPSLLFLNTEFDKVVRSLNSIRDTLQCNRPMRP